MVVFFFFFKQKTAYEMRISDWSSDVCSSDLHHRGQRDHPQGTLRILVVRCAEEVVQMLGGGGFGHAAYLFRIAACSTRGVGVRGWKRRVVSGRSEAHTSELQTLMRISYAVFCLKNNIKKTISTNYLFT